MMIFGFGVGVGVGVGVVVGFWWDDELRKDLIEKIILIKFLGDSDKIAQFHNLGATFLKSWPKQNVKKLIACAARESNPSSKNGNLTW